MAAGVLLFLRWVFLVWTTDVRFWLHGRLILFGWMLVDWMDVKTVGFWLSGCLFHFFSEQSYGASQKLRNKLQLGWGGVTSYI